MLVLRFAVRLVVVLSARILGRVMVPLNETTDVFTKVLRSCMMSTSLNAIRVLVLTAQTKRCAASVEMSVDLTR